MGIKETKELLEGLGEAGIIVKKIAKDGLTVTDLQYITEIAGKFEVFSKAFEGVGEIPKELKDLDQAEVLALIGVLYNLAAKFNEA